MQGKSGPSKAVCLDHPYRADWCNTVNNQPPRTTMHCKSLTKRHQRSSSTVSNTVLRRSESQHATMKYVRPMPSLVATSTIALAAYSKHLHQELAGRSDLCRKTSMLNMVKCGLTKPQCISNDSSKAQPLRKYAHTLGDLHHTGSGQHFGMRLFTRYKCATGVSAACVGILQARMSCSATSAAVSLLAYLVQS